MYERGPRSDQAAYAAWLSYIAGKTQGEVAEILGVSRPAVQRLLLRATEEGMIKVRIDHPTTQCLELSAKIASKYGLQFCRVVPTIPDIDDEPSGVSHELASEIEKWLRSEKSLSIGLGTGKTLRAAIGHIPHIECQQHNVVSLAGNIAPDGSVAKYNVLFSIADKVSALAYSLPMPLIAATDAELSAVMAQRSIKKTMAFGANSDIAFVGIGELNSAPPLLTDGFISKGELRSLRKAGAIGEIIGWCFDKEGKILKGYTNARVASIPLPLKPGSLVIAAAKGVSKLPAIKGAITGGLIHGLITDEKAGRALLESK